VLLACFLANAQTIDPWKITASEVDPANYYGITVGNGMIGVVPAPEPFRIKNVVLAGAYDLFGRGRVSNFLNSFNLLNIDLAIDGDRARSSIVSNFRQELNMRDATFTSTFDYQDKASVKYTYYALRHMPYSVLCEVIVTPKKSLTISASSVMETPDALKDGQNYFNEISKPHTRISLLTSTAKSPTGKLQLCASTTFMFDEEHSRQPHMTHEMRNSNMHIMKFSKTLEAGEQYRFAVVGTSITSAHNDDPLNAAERLTIAAKLQGIDRLKMFHQQAWNDLWKSDIQIEGDPQAQQDVHSMLYHLYSFSRADIAFSPSPMGLSGLGYNGHVFWDTDVWMYPAMLVLHPEIAKSMIEYRFERLEAARRNALANGYKGAMYPWESAASGVEETPVWALSGPFEHHISACVALAAWQYYCVTRDKTWLREKGYPILAATADFWASRVERNGPGHYDIKNVVAADEWAENVDNDAFTNAAAQLNLMNATKAADILGLTANLDWMQVAKNIPISKMDNGVTREHDQYKGEGIKQGDVNLLAYPLKTIADPAQISKDLAYYETRVPKKGTPAMTQAIFALLYSRLGDSEKSYHFFKDSYQPNLNPPFRVIAETKGGSNPYFATGAGGVLQSLLMGFGGIDITDTGLKTVKSTLPAHWKKLTITGVGPERKEIVVEGKGNKVR